MKKIHIIGGGTFSHVRNHFALAAPAFGETASRIAQILDTQLHKSYAVTGDDRRLKINLHLTRMAGGLKTLETNEDVGRLLDEIVADPDSKIVFMNAAMCDFDGNVLDWSSEWNPKVSPSGKYEKRLSTRNLYPSEKFGDYASVIIRPAPKAIAKLRKTRKDLFVIGFKTTTNASEDEQYMAGLQLLKESSLNIVLANDTVTRTNMIIVPEEARYSVTQDRQAALEALVTMALDRSKCTFTRSTVVEGDKVAWDSPEIPVSLRVVVNWLIENNAYKTFLGKTVGHFAVRGRRDGEIITSIRKSNFNKLAEIGMVRVEAVGDDKVIAYGAKPSVGGQSQRIVFKEHPDLDCIVHFHSPKLMKSMVPVHPQFPYECGSHECGRNTSRGLERFGNLKAVMLANHGPNIVFNRNIDPQEVIDFIVNNFDVAEKTGGQINDYYKNERVVYEKGVRVN